MPSAISRKRHGTTPTSPRPTPGSRSGCRTMLRRESPTRISSSRRRLRRWCTGSLARKAVRSRELPKKTSASPTSDTTRATPDASCRRGGEMVDAWIDGEHATLDAAASEAAKLLRVSRLPLIAGLDTDVAGAGAAIELAARIGGVIDHMHSEPLLRDLDVAREAGMMVITRIEAALVADTVLVVGPGVEPAWPELHRELVDRRMGLPSSQKRRRILRL